MRGSVIDTNVVIKMLDNDRAAIALLGSIERAYLPAVVAGELLYGAYKSSRKQENLTLFQSVISKFEMLFVDKAVANSYGIIKAELVAKGNVIPENDVWIAAIAHANGLSLATFDAHFKNVSEIAVIGPP